MLYGDFDVAQSMQATRRKAAHACREGHTELSEIKGAGGLTLSLMVRKRVIGAVSNHEMVWLGVLSPSFETPRRAWLLRMRAEWIRAGPDC
jgi:hypothetical protein